MISEILKENKFPAFRYAQIENALYKNFITDFQEMGTIPKGQSIKGSHHNMLVKFKTDGAITKTGFSATYYSGSLKGLS